MGKGRAPCCDKTKVKRGPWSPSEDAALISFIHKHGHTNWRALPRQAGLLRCGKSCRLRWINYLRPDVKRGNFTPEEEQTIINLHSTFGNKWSKIAARLPGRTDNEIKNVWNTHIKKKLQANSTPDNRTGSNPDGPPPSSSTSSSITTSEGENPEITRLPISSDDHPFDSNSPTSSYASNLSNSIPDSVFALIPDDHVINPNSKIEIPFEPGIDFWEVLDWLEPAENGGTESGSDHELGEKLRLLENELGLTGDAALTQQQVLDLEQEIGPGWDHFPLWPSSPVNLGI